jgi:putative hydrolase of the HAD superfamily
MFLPAESVKLRPVTRHGAINTQTTCWEQGNRMAIEVILFDADGVVQRQSAPWRDALGDLLGSTDGALDDFLSDVFAVEHPLLTSQSEFAAVLGQVLARWGCVGSLDDALRVWTMIKVDEEVVQAIQRVRHTGVSCCLATNQHLYRARYMSETLEYDRLFDREFYSCNMGVAKPNPDFFRAILEDLRLPADNVLFLDDHEANVSSARQVGLHASVFDAASGTEALSGMLGEFGIVLS